MILYFLVVNGIISIEYVDIKANVSILPLRLNFSYFGDVWFFYCFVIYNYFTQSIQNMV